MQRATAVPRKTNVSFHDEVRLSLPSLTLLLFACAFTYAVHYRDVQTIPPQSRLFKSLKLWSFYVDLEESIGTVESAKAVYEKIFELKVANAQIVVNFAEFLEEGGFWEESFKVRWFFPRVLLLAGA